MYKINRFAIWLVFIFICVVEKTWNLAARVKFKISSITDKDWIFLLTKKKIKRLVFLEYSCQIAYKHVSCKCKTETFYTCNLYFEIHMELLIIFNEMLIVMNNANYWRWSMPLTDMQLWYVQFGMHYWIKQFWIFSLISWCDFQQQQQQIKHRHLYTKTSHVFLQLLCKNMMRNNSKL